MKTVNLFDGNFAHSIGECGFDTCIPNRRPQKVQWIRNNFRWSDVTVFTDGFLKEQCLNDVESKYKVGWLIEPRSIHPHIYEDITKIEHMFDLILTFDKDLLERGKKYQRFIFGGSMLKDIEWKIYSKTKNASIISSWKMETEGHKLRHQIAQSCPQLDLWGRGFKSFDSKLDPLQDYYFSVVIENASYNYYITEKIIDCFATGTVPIYWGCSDIGDIFNPDGIISFSNFDDFAKIKLSTQRYRDMMPAIEDNFERAKIYRSTDDQVVDIISKNFEL